MSLPCAKCSPRVKATVLVTNWPSKDWHFLTYLYLWPTPYSDSLSSSHTALISLCTHQGYKCHKIFVFLFTLLKNSDIYFLSDFKNQLKYSLLGEGFTGHLPSIYFIHILYFCLFICLLTFDKKSKGKWWVSLIEMSNI